jgi:SAM-dependent methyltransferase
MVVFSNREDGMGRGDGEQSPTIVLRRLVDGYQISQALYVVATLGIADLLGDGCRTSDDLAEQVGAHAESLHRVLRALASVGVLRDHDDRSFSLTAVGQCLRSDAPQPVGGWAAFIGRPYQWTAWGHLLDGVLSGKTAFVSVHGISGWEYRAQHPEENAIFDRAMTDLTRRVSESIVDAHDFARYGTVMDVGGGRGALLAALLRRHPHLRGILFDQPHVVAGSADVLDAASMRSRCEIVAGSFFDGVPPGADAYILKTVLHDWEDEHARRILRQCRRAMTDGGVLVLAEWDLGGPCAARDAKFSDLNMMVGNGGRGRTVGQFASLLRDTGFRLESHTPTPIGLAVMECLPVSL